MTTIVYKDGIMATDTQGTRGSLIMPNRSRKIMKNEFGIVIGGSGTIRQIQKYFRKIKNCKNISEAEKIYIEYFKPHDFTLLLFFDDILYLSELDGFVELNNVKYYSIGSGSSYALGALETGVSAVEAVKIASIFDTKTNDKIDTIVLKEQLEKSVVNIKI